MATAEVASGSGYAATFTGIEALAHYRYPDIRSSGARFRAFIRGYFSPRYHDRADDLWKLRNGLIHAFNPGPFALVFHRRDLHLRRTHDRVILNAEDFYWDLAWGSRPRTAVLPVY